MFIFCLTSARLLILFQSARPKHLSNIILNILNMFMPRFFTEKIHTSLKPIPLFYEKKERMEFLPHVPIKHTLFLRCATNPVFPGVPLWCNTGTDIGTEEMAHFEMICAIVHQLTKDLTPEQIKEQGFADYYVDHTLGLWPQSAGGTPFTATYFQSKGDPITDLTEDMAADDAASYKQLNSKVK